MYFTCCFQISFVLKSNNLRFSALCLDSENAFAFCSPPPVLLSLTEKCVVGKATDFTCFLTFWRFVVQTECDWRLFVKFMSPWHTGIALFPWLQLLCVQCSQVTAGWRLPTQTLPSGTPVALGALRVVFSTFSRSYCAARAELRGEGLVHPPVLLQPLRRFCSY